MKVILFFLYSSILIIASCNEANPGIRPAGSTASSTAGTTGKKMQVVFFTPSSNELAAMVEQTGDVEGTMAGLDDFERNAGKFMDSTGIPGVQARISDAPVIQLTMENGEVFTLKRDENNKYGAIFFDGVQQPRVTQGLYLDFEYRDIARSYFGVE